MVFSSIIFMFYFLPATLVGYFLCGFSRTLQNIWLLLASLLFYAWGEPLFVLVMLGSITMNHIFGVMVDRWRLNKSRARMIICLTVIFNIGILFVYKYLGFVIENINLLIGRDLLHFQNPGLPLGISFFTFQALSYVIDVYRQRAKVEKNPFYVGLYIAFFPALVAGPIVRFADIADQLRNRRMSWDLFSSGCARFTLGVGKKIIIANSLAAVADRVFNLSASGNHVVMVPAMLAWLGLLAYTMQIYFDFSSYSDMAIGLGRMFGFSLKENFNYPYISLSVTEFWRRWHISLSSWFREYVYIPLGGSRPRVESGIGQPARRNLKVVRNLFVVWLLTGIWHGADWSFIIWGMWYFIFILFERVTKLTERNIPAVVSHIYLLMVVIIGWVFFRSASMHDAFVYLSNLFNFNHNGFYSELAMVFIKENWLYLSLGVLLSAPLDREFGRMLQAGTMGRWGRAFNMVYPLFLTTVYVISVTYLVKGNYKPFIYFNF